MLTCNTSYSTLLIPQLIQHLFLSYTCPLQIAKFQQKLKDKQDNFNFEIVNFLFLDGYVPPFPSYGVLQKYVLILMTSTIEKQF